MDLQAPAYLKIKKVVGSEVLEAALEAGFVGSQKEELQPEAVGMQDLIFVLILQISAPGMQLGSSLTLKSSSYRREILGWKELGRACWVRGEAMME